MTNQKMICIKSEIIFFAKYETVIGEAYLILETPMISYGKNHYYIYREGNLESDLGLCNIDNFITIAEWREQQIKSVLDD
jgi:hypothetical protein